MAKKLDGKSFCCRRQKSVLLRTAKECLSFWVAKESFSFWEAKEFLQQAEKEFSSYAAKIREGKARESMELQPLVSIDGVDGLEKYFKLKYMFGSVSNV